MSIDKLTPLGDTGSLESTTTFEDWVAGGFVDERVRYTRLNRQFNRGDNKINEVIDRGPSVVTPGADALAVAITGVYSTDDSGMTPADSGNVIDTGAALDSTLLLWGVMDGSPKLFSRESGGLVKIYDVETMAFEQTVASSVWEAGLDTTGTQVWIVKSFCLDRENIYVAFEESNASPKEYWVQAYRLSDLTPLSTWPATGTQLTAGSASYTSDEYNIINATSAVDGKLAVSQPWVVLATGASAGINIIDKTDGTSDGTGAGDLGSVSNGQIRRIASNGEYIFAVESDSSGFIEFLTMSIASPGATGLSLYRGTHPNIADANLGGLCVCGSKWVITYSGGTDLFSSFSTNGLLAHFQTADADVISDLHQVVTDGFNFWAEGIRNAEGYAADLEDMLFRLDGIRIGGYQVTGETYIETYTNGDEYVTGHRWFVGDSNDGITPDAICCSGDAIWMFANTSGNSYIYRFCKPVLR